MGGRGSSGSHNAGGKSSKNIGAGITDRNELVNLYNSISGNSSYTAEERVRAMSSIKEKIDEIDSQNVKPKIKIKKGTPYLKDLNDYEESKALKEKTLKDIERLQKKTQWYGDKKLNDIKSQLQATSHFDSEDVLFWADRFFNHKSEHIKRIKWMERGY